MILTCLATKKKEIIFINAEIMPPVYENALRAKRLNTFESYKNWANDENVEKQYDNTAKYKEIYHPSLCNVKLIAPIVDLKVVFKLKRLLNYNNSVQHLLNECRNPPTIIKSKAKYDEMKKMLNNNPDFSELLILERISDYWN